MRVGSTVCAALSLSRKRELGSVEEKVAQVRVASRITYGVAFASVKTRCGRARLNRVESAASVGRSNSR